MTELATAQDRKFRAKRWNEHVKSVYSVSNTIAAFIAGTGFIAPLINNGSRSLDLDARGWVLTGFLVHLFGHWVVWRYMRPEE